MLPSYLVSVYAMQEKGKKFLKSDPKSKMRGNATFVNRIMKI